MALQAIMLVTHTHFVVCVTSNISTKCHKEEGSSTVADIIFS